VVVAAAVAFAVVRPLRQRATSIVGQLKEALAVLHSPAAVVRLLAFNLAAELLFALTVWTVLRAFGQPVDLVDVIIINEAVALFAGLVPVPGGVGVTEGALTAGFIAVGVPQDVAFSAALSYRMCTFYLPPIWGYLAFNSLQREGYL
jgi:glycosyltransferase 2 family protein